MRLDSKDSSFTEISDKQIACHQSRLTELNCVLPKILHLFSTTTLIPFDEIMHFANKNYVIHIGNIFGLDKIHWTWILEIDSTIVSIWST